MVLDDELTIQEYNMILDSVGWKKPSERLLKISLKNSMTVKYTTNGKTVGMARLVTDGGYSGLIMDVVVLPEYQNQGIGKMLINRLLQRKKDQLEEGEEAMIQLLAAPGTISFYNQFGFKVKLTTAEAGMYMWMQK